jgi:hypothetical protein
MRRRPSTRTAGGLDTDGAIDQLRCMTMHVLDQFSLRRARSDNQPLFRWHERGFDLAEECLIFDRALARHASGLVMQMLVRRCVDYVHLFKRLSVEEEDFGLVMIEPDNRVMLLHAAFAAAVCVDQR